MPIKHDPKTGKFSSGGGSAGGSSKAFIKPGAAVKENRSGAPTLHVISRNGNMVKAAERHSSGSFGSPQSMHVSKLVKA